jgi:tetratricopeptide (TPR) repeat protein
LAFHRSDPGKPPPQRSYEEARRLYRKVGDVCGEANCVYSLGYVALRRAAPDEGGCPALEEARLHYEEARRLYRQVEDERGRRGEADCIRCLGLLARRRSEYDVSLRFYEEARRLYQQVGYVRGEANCMRGFGKIALAQADRGAATDWLERALPLFKEVGDLEDEGACLWELGDVARDAEALPVAKERYKQALACCERFGDPRWIGVVHRRLARITEGEEKQRHVQAARDAWTRIDRPDLIGELDREFGG